MEEPDVVDPARGGEVKKRPTPLPFALGPQVPLDRPEDRIDVEAGDRGAFVPLQEAPYLPGLERQGAGRRGDGDESRPGPVLSIWPALARHDHGQRITAV